MDRKVERAQRYLAVSQRMDVEVEAPAFVLGHRPWLDGIRAIAILTVMGFHLKSLLPVFGGAGIAGLEVFFVLSGFLITILLLEEVRRSGRIRLSAFYVRRARRLLPALSLLLLGVAALMVVGLPELPRGEVAIQIMAVAGYAGNWVKAFSQNDLGVLGHTWSLSVEEQFYLLWPVSLLFFLRSGITGRRLATLLLVGAAASMLWREVVLRQGDRVLANNHAYFGLDTRGYALLLGCAVAVIVHHDLYPKAPPWAGLRAVAAGAAGAFAVTFFLFSDVYPTGYAVYLNLMAFATAVVILHLSLAPKGRVHRLLGLDPLVAIGRVSYGLYLYHFPVIVLLTPDRVGLGGAPLGIVDVAVTGVLATASWMIVERRFIRRRST